MILSVNVGHLQLSLPMPGFVVATCLVLGASVKLRDCVLSLAEVSWWKDRLVLHPYLQYHRVGIAEGMWTLVTSYARHSNRSKQHPERSSVGMSQFLTKI